MRKSRPFRLGSLGAAVVLATTFPTQAADKNSHAAHWSYAGKGAPDHWGSLSDEFSLCSAGKRQSPIDIPAHVKSAPAPMSFHYQQSPLKVLNNGHTIQVNYAPGSYAELDGKRYELLQFHFHSPSEHTVAGKHHDMEVHLVHRDKDGKLAVVGIFLRKGDEHPALKPVWNTLPKSQGEMDAKGVSVDAAKLLPARKEVHRYPGSLTTPPCSENVSWFVMAEPIEVSAAQIKAFQAIVPPNARPVQALNGRL